jgi:hypothetical protein
MGDLLPFFALLIPLSGVFAVVKMDQKTRDRQRKTYQVTFPADLTHGAVVNWIRSLMGVTRGSPGMCTIVFETWSTSAGIQHILKVPWQTADYVIGQLTAHVGVSYFEVVPPRQLFTRAVEVRMSDRTKPLRIYSPTAVAHSILKAVSEVGSDEALMTQLVISPIRPARPPIEGNKDELSEERNKLSEPNVVATFRVGAVANTKPRADHLIERVKGAVSGTTSPFTGFEKRIATLGQLQRRIDEGMTPISFGLQLTAPELATLISWPLDGVVVAGLPSFTGKRLPPSEQIPQEGIVIGRSVFPGAERPVAIGYREALMHTHVIGSTGVGKTNVLALMARQIMNAGHGLVVIETEGNLYQSVLDYVPSHRADDLVLLDVSDTQHPVGFNVLDQGDPLTVIDQLIELLSHKYGESLWLEEYVYHGLRTMADVGGLAITDLMPLLRPRTTEEIEWADEITRNLKDPDLRRWWQGQDNRDRKQQQQRTDPVTSRFWQLASRPELKHIFGQSQSSFQMSEVLDQGKILLVNLKGVSGATADLAGTMMMDAIWRSTKASVKPKPVFIMLDEFGDWLDLPVNTASFLVQARKQNVGMILAHQYMGQLSKQMGEAMITNARNTIAFNVGNDDARAISREMGDINPIDLTTLPTYEAMARVMTPSGVSRPVSIKTEPPKDKNRNARQLVDASRAKYSTPVEQVRRDMQERVTPKSRGNGKRPRISGFVED